MVVTSFDRKRSVDETPTLRLPVSSLNVLLENHATHLRNAAHDEGRAGQGHATRCRHPRCVPLARGRQLNDQGKVTPDVAAWTDSQNSYTRSVLDTLPERLALEQRLRPLMEVGSVTPPIVRANRYFFTKREGNQNQPVVYWREGYKGESRVLIDPARLDDSGLTTVEWFSPSPDGRLLAPGSFQRPYRAPVWRSWGLPWPGTGSKVCSRRSDQSA